MALHETFDTDLSTLWTKYETKPSQWLVDSGACWASPTTEGCQSILVPSTFLAENAIVSAGVRSAGGFADFGIVARVSDSGKSYYLLQGEFDNPMLDGKLGIYKMTDGIPARLKSTVHKWKFPCTLTLVVTGRTIAVMVDNLDGRGPVPLPDLYTTDLNPLTGPGRVGLRRNFGWAGFEYLSATDLPGLCP